MAAPERPQTERSEIDRPQTGRVQTEGPQIGRLQAYRPQIGRLQADHPQVDRSQADPPYTGRPQGDRPQPDRPQADRPQAERPQAERPQTDRPRAERPLAGRLALVTGAGQGIGRAIARRLAADGAQVAANDREPGSRLDELATEIGGFPAPADVSDRDAVRAMVAGIEARVGRSVDILVANAAYMAMAPLTDHDPDDWWRVVDTNLTGTFHLTQAVLPGMRRVGGGRIVIMASYWGLCGWPGATAYAASKAGLVALAKTLGRELAPENIVVNAIAPGVIDTPQLQVDADDAGVALDEIRARYAQGVPLGRIGRPEEVAAAVALLADPVLGAMVGQVVQINGGELRGRA